MSYTQQLIKLDKKTLGLVNDIVKLLSETDEVYEENWNKISKKPFKSFKINKKSRKKTGYYVYSSNADIRTKIKEEHPEQSKNIGFVSKLISEQWKNLSNEDKEVYNKEAEELNSQSETETDNIVTKKKSPKRSAYNCYIGNKSLRSQIKSSSSEKLSMLEVNKILSGMWKEMTDEEKDVYVKEAEEYNSKLSEDEEVKDEEVKDEEVKNEEVKNEEVNQELKKKKSVVVKKKVVKK